MSTEENQPEVKKRRARKPAIKTEAPIGTIVTIDAEAGISESSAPIIKALDLPSVSHYQNIPHTDTSCPMCDAGIPLSEPKTVFVETDDNEVLSQVDIPDQGEQISDMMYRETVIEELMKNPHYSERLMAEKIADLIIEGKLSLAANGRILINGKPPRKKRVKGYHAPVTKEQKKERNNKNKLAKQSRQKNRR